MTYNQFEEGLKQRGFKDIEFVDSTGKCSKDDCHYILLTDGVVIYSSVPNYKNVKYLSGEISEWWDFPDGEYVRRPFSFSELDNIIENINQLKQIENHK